MYILKSGKSDIYNAFEYMVEYVIESFKYGDEEGFEVYFTLS